MANEIVWDGVSTGSTKYFTIQRVTDRGMWNTAGTPGFEALTVANWANYAISLTETPFSSYFYVGSWPATLTTVGFYRVNIYKCSATTPDISDRATRMMGTYKGYWNGTKFEINATDCVQVGGTAQTAGDICATMSKPGMAQTITPADTAAATTAFGKIGTITGTDGKALVSTDTQTLTALKVNLVDAPNSTALAAIKTALGLPTGLKKNVATNISFPMYLSGTDQLATGKTVTVVISKDLAAYAATTNSAAELTSGGSGTGTYSLAFAQAETNYSIVQGLATAPGCDPTPFTLIFNA